MRTSERDSFTRIETTSSDTLQRRDQLGPGAYSDLTATPPAKANLTPGPGSGEQDGERMN